MLVSQNDVEAQANELLSDPRVDVDIPLGKRVFCNRNLRMDQIEMIGFDMDYTLALYHQDKLETLSIQITLEKLVRNHGYPAAILDLEYRASWAIRGLMVDRHLGHVFKADRHSYVGRCYHGKRRLSSTERKTTYANTKINLSEDRYEWVDTLFGLPDAIMFTTLVEWNDTTHAMSVSYDQLWSDIRQAIDEAHRDDTLKSVIKANLADFIVKDPELPQTLHRFRLSGKKLFLLTNSLYDYTDAVMQFLLEGPDAPYKSWRDYFDFVIVGGSKPGFFSQKHPFRLVDTQTGAPLEGEVTRLSGEHVVQGGNVLAFEQMTNVRGENVLYIGDHIYGDILRLRKQHMWRTAMVLQELEREIAVNTNLAEAGRDIDLLDRRRRNLESNIEFQSIRVRRMQDLLPRVGPSLRGRLQTAIDVGNANVAVLGERHRLLAQEVDALDTHLDEAFNPYWGSVLREGNEASRFGEQLRDYADLYTSRVSNFGAYSPVRYFRAPRTPLPHEM